MILFTKFEAEGIQQEGYLIGIVFTTTRVCRFMGLRDTVAASDDVLIF